ncbi:FKBP-type peptidyl-prolyl cis-trans isomerase [Trueperella bialowiezensis]|uniref:peptidylprolyl isomerase n=1 Tax=Trueperella bialowiezensis TaxID=312285 RepID=A0A3S4X4K4_9ACTO|nr:FKBP-type peptidyl-prolyl cis-trans isomerase [Trueperella bialowiezensis]VEI12534.1 FK506-binding protein [Trueperella bialowiezensis]
MRKLAMVAALALLLSGCSGSDDPSPSADPSETASPIEYGTDMPTLDTSGEHPKLAFPGPNPVEGLKVEVVEEGTGRIVEAGDVVVAHYVGQVWGSSDPFDSSFERGEPSSFSLQQVIRGWTEGLSGLPVGSKVIVSIPPEYGYGPTGQPNAGIGGTDTIAFYVELHSALGINDAGHVDAEMKVDLAELPVEITGELGKPVTVKVKDGVKAPEGEPQVTVIAEGKGEPVGEAGTIMYQQYAMSSWDNSVSEVTYGQFGPQKVLIGNGSVFDKFSGIPVGSRVLLQVPASDGGENSTTAPAFAAVVDIIDQMPSPNPPGDQGKQADEAK